MCLNTAHGLAVSAPFIWRYHMEKIYMLIRRYYYYNLNYLGNWTPEAVLRRGILSAELVASDCTSTSVSDP